MRIRHYFSTLLVMLSFALVFNACKKDNPTDPGGGNGTTVKTTISGTVLDEFDSPVAGAQVSLSGQTTVTNSGGGFLFSNVAVPKDRFVVNVTKSNFFDGSIADVPKSGGVTNVKVYLLKAEQTANVNSTSGGTVATANGTGVELPANAVVNADGSAFTGNVKMQVAYLDPTSESFATTVPGGDLRAQRTDNTQTTLYSYGVIKVDLKNDSGNDLELKSGSESKVTVDIPPSMEADAPATIPLWHYDKTSGLWIEEGTATKTGDKYIGYVKHFSDWNCDVPGGTGTVKGLVVDCNNAPVGGITVKIGQGSAVTGSDGKFERRVPINVNFEVQVIGSRNFGLTSSPVSVTGLTEGQVKDLGTFAVPCPAYIKGKIMCGTDVKHGQVVVSWQGGYNAQYTETDGTFKIAVDINQNAQLSVYTYDGKYKVINVQTPLVRGDTKDVGTIEACDQAQLGENKFTLNGDGFNSQTFDFGSDSLMVYGWMIQDTTTMVAMYKIVGTDTTLCLLYFSGQVVGPANVILMEAKFNDKFYVFSEGLPNGNGVINLTKYSGPGGMVEGTFSGTLGKYPTFTTFVTLSNGKFSVINRILKPDLEKLIKKSFPQSQWNRLLLK